MSKGNHISYKASTLEVKRCSENCPVGKNGIYLKNLKPSFRNIIKKNEIFRKYKTEDDYENLVEAILRIEHEYDKYYKFNDRIYIEKVGDDILLGKKEDILENRKIHEWRCAYCKCVIYAREDDFSPQNFCCQRCAEIYLGRETIKTAVLESSYRFSEMLKAKIRRRESIMLSYIKENLNK